MALIQGAPTTPPKAQAPGAPALKSKDDDEAAVLLEQEMGWAKRLGKEARKHG